MAFCQVCYKNGSDRTKYLDVVLDNKQTTNDAIAIVKANASKLGISPLTYISRGNAGIQSAGQYNEFKPGTMLDGDWDSFNFREVLIEGVADYNAKEN